MQYRRFTSTFVQQQLPRIVLRVARVTASPGGSTQTIIIIITHQQFHAPLYQNSVWSIIAKMSGTYQFREQWCGNRRFSAALSKTEKEAFDYFN